MPQIEVTFDIDANGIVNVTAKDKATGKEQQIKIEASGGLTQSDIDRMVREAEANVEGDKKRRALVEARNHADGQIAVSQRALDEAGDKASAPDKAPVEAAIGSLKTAMAGDSVEEIESKANALLVASTNFGAKLYDGAAASGNGQSSTGEADENIVDADFEEIEDEGGTRHG